jgi:tRNA(Ile2) C34 agmatinyltransferase TiaS
MSDVSIGDLIPTPTPACPVCGGETVLTDMHKAVAKVTDVFRCKRCDVEYPVVRKGNVA